MVLRPVAIAQVLDAFFPFKLESDLRALKRALGTDQVTQPISFTMLGSRCRGDKSTCFTHELDTWAHG